MPIASNSRLFVAPAVLRILVRIIILSVVALLVTSYSVFAQTEVVSAERVLFDALNRERTAQGLPRLQWDEALASAAREHAVRMAQRNVLSHQLPGEPPVQDRATRAGARFSLIAENIAVAPSPAVIHSVVDAVAPSPRKYSRSGA